MRERPHSSPHCIHARRALTQQLLHERDVGGPGKEELWAGEQLHEGQHFQACGEGPRFDVRADVCDDGEEAGVEARELGAAVHHRLVEDEEQQVSVRAVKQGQVTAERPAQGGGEGAVHGHPKRTLPAEEEQREGADV